MNLGEIMVRFAADVTPFTSGAHQVQDSLAGISGSAQVHMSGFVQSVHGGLSSLLEFGAHAYQTFLGVKGAIESILGPVQGWIQGAIGAAQAQSLLNAH